MASSEVLKQLFVQAGTFKPFSCAECEARDVFVSGPHSHVCEVCGARARWGFYTTPRCADHRTIEQGG